jgi:hypothetical protein
VATDLDRIRLFSAMQVKQFGRCAVVSVER